MALNRKLLGIYLNDHLLGSTAGRQVAKRALRENRGNQFGAFLEQLLEEIREDRATLLDVMRALGARQDRLKQAAAVAGERLGRLKLNGSLTGYSPLSRLVELEALAIGIHAKRLLWMALERLDEPSLAEFDLAALQARARRQGDDLERLRLEAARLALQDA